MSTSRGRTGNVTSCKCKELQERPKPRDAKSGAVAVDVFFSDSELQSVVAAWPDLPKAIKAGILAMVDVSQRADRS